MKISRRTFLKGSLTTLFLAGTGFPVYSSSKAKKNLVVIMLRGGMDALCAVPVIGDKNFEKRRKELILDNTVKLSSDFSLHPVLENFHELWKEKQGAIVHATNIPYTERSHFDGQNLMESGGKIPYQKKTGWLGRGMKIAGLKGNGLALALPMPLLIRGVPMNNNYFPVGYKLPYPSILKSIQEAFNEYDEKLLSENLEIVRTRKLSNTGSDKSWILATNAGTELSRPDGPRVAVFEVDGFDTHAAQGNGELAGTALESPMRVALKVDLEKNIGIPGPWIQTSGPVARHLDAKGYHITCGVHEDLVEAARLATRHMIDLLGKVHGLLPIDAYLLCSVCGDLAISEMVNKPVSVVSLYFPRVVLE